MRILIVDDDEEVTFALGRVFQREGFDCAIAHDGQEAIAKVATENPTVIFMDISMPKLNGLDALRRLRETHRLVPVVIITGFGTLEHAVTAVRNGAFEYLTKPLDIETVRDVTRRAVASVRSAAAPQRSSLASFKAVVANRYEIVGTSARMQEVYKLIGSVSTTPNHTSVMIRGESGTGKELVARAIHAMSSTAQEPFVAINCTALPETLLESELFGHERGAFTGATDRKIGKFELAAGGTIFLDEVANLSPNLQQKLLRVLQEREFERLGGNRPIEVKSRFVAATNRDLDSEVERASFREDLFYRLNVVAIHLPPLRDRMEDVPLLATHFLSKYSAQLTKAISGFSERAMEVLQTYTYPGNVRELENLIERAVMLTSGEVVLPEALQHISSSAPPPGGPVSLPMMGDRFTDARDRLLEVFEKQFVTEMLTKYHGRVTDAAQASGITRQYFRQLMDKHGIVAKTFR